MSQTEPPKLACAEVYGCVVVRAERPVAEGAPWTVTVRCVHTEAIVLAAVPAADEFSAGRAFQRLWPTTVDEIREFAAGRKS